MKNKQILITGARGFIGCHATRICASRGHEVVGIGRGSWSEQEHRALGLSRWYSTDAWLTDKHFELDGFVPDIILHCAGGSSVALSVQAPEKDRRNTVDSTQAVLNFMAAYAPRAKLVYPSSAAVYGVADHFPIPENCPLRPVSPYGRHKVEAEDLCQRSGLNVSIVRLFSVYGEGLRKQLLFDACKKICSNESMFFGTGHETRDWLHIQDAVELLLKAAEQASPECVRINGGTGIATEIREVLSVLFDFFGRDPRSIKFTGQVRQGDPLHYQADILKAKSLGWKPEIEWKTGVREYAQWFKSHNEEQSV